MKSRKSPPLSLSKLLGRGALFTLAGLGLVNICMFLFSGHLPSLDLKTTSSNSNSQQTRSTSSKEKTGAFIGRHMQFVKRLHSSGKDSVDTWLEQHAGSHTNEADLFIHMRCEDEATDCKDRKLRGKCNKNVTDDAVYCKKSCGLCPVIGYSAHGKSSLPVAAVNELPPSCVDVAPNCDAMVANDQCSTNPSLMLLKCKAACGFCSRADLQPADCRDSLDLCPYLANSLSMCRDPSTSWWMSSECRGSCGACAAGKPVVEIAQLKHLVDPDNACADYHSSCEKWHTNNPSTCRTPFMMQHCPKICKACDRAGNGAQAAITTVQIGEDKNANPSVSLYFPLIGSSVGAQGAEGGPCTDRNTACQGWAETGECQKNAAYMLLECRRSCKMCGGGVSAGGVPSGSKTYLPHPLAKVKLNNGEMMPLVGFGTAAMGQDTYTAVKSALQAGYRHIDSAQAREWYREDLVGAAIRDYTEIQREDLFITTKIHPRHIGYQMTIDHFQQSLLDLHTTYVDLVLLHYPNCWGNLCDGSPTPTETFHDTWRAFEELVNQGKVKSIGISNFAIADVQSLLAAAKIKPQVLQTNVDPLNPNIDLLNFCRNEGIQVVAYSTLGTQHPAIEPGHRNPVLTDPTIVTVAKATGKSPAQVTLRWALQLGVAVIPRSTNPAHMAEGLELYSFELDPDQMLKITNQVGKPIPQNINAVNMQNNVVQIMR